jgi:Icc-related predicted phosphoesterase
MKQEASKKVLTEEDIFNQKDIDAVTDYINKETLKEASKRYSANELSQLGFINGAKWQQEQSYSDEKLYSEIEWLIISWNNDGTKTAGHLTRQIIEQFKKK